VLIEALIVIPLLMMITLGIIEYGGAYREDSAVAAASRAGARVASSLPKTDFCVAPCSSDSGLTVAAAVASALQSLGSNAPRQLWIYDVATAGSGPPSFSGCTNCVGYDWVPSTKTFSPTYGTGWLSSNQNACSGSAVPPDQIGIYVRVNHTAVTRMFGGDRSLTGTTIMRFEPFVGAVPCAAVPPVGP
jgi:hypothetical protein